MVREGNTWRPCGTYARPARHTWYAARPSSSVPAKRIDPLARGGWMPMMALQRVVLPMPFRPMMAVVCSVIAKDTSCRT